MWTGCGVFLLNWVVNEFWEVGSCKYRLCLIFVSLFKPLAHKRISLFLFACLDGFLLQILVLMSWEFTDYWPSLGENPKRSGKHSWVGLTWSLLLGFSPNSSFCFTPMLNYKFSLKLWVLCIMDFEKLLLTLLSSWLYFCLALVNHAIQVFCGMFIEQILTNLYEMLTARLANRY